MSESKEKVFYKGEATLKIKKTVHHGTGRKIASLLAGGVIGYFAFGRDKKKTTEIKGGIIITDKAIYCKGYRLPLDHIIGFEKKKKSIYLNFDTTMSNEKMTIESEIKAENLDEIMDALEKVQLASHGVELE